MKLRIRQPSMHPGSSSVQIDGFDITKSLMSVTVDWNASDVTVAHLKIMVDDVDIDTETVAHLQAMAHAADAKKELARVVAREVGQRLSPSRQVRYR